METDSDSDISSVVTPVLPEDSLISIVKNLFSLIDINNDGTLTKHECLKSFQRNDTSAYTLVSNISNEHPSAASLRLLLKPSTYKATFQSMDTDLNGRISIDELIYFCQTNHFQKDNSNNSNDDDNNEATTNNITEEINDQTAMDALLSLQKMCATIHHLDGPRLLDIRKQVVQIGSKHEKYFHRFMDEKVNLRKINQFTSQTRGELMASLINPPEKVKQVCLPLCTLYNLPKKWINVRSSVKQMQSGSTAIFKRFRTALINHDKKIEEKDYTNNHTVDEFPPIVSDIKIIVDNRNLIPNEVAKVSVAAASLVYLYSGLIEYANAWLTSKLHRRVVDFCKKNISDIDECSKLHDRTSGLDAEETKRIFHESFHHTLTSNLRRSAAIQTVLGGSSAMSSKSNLLFSPLTTSKKNGKKMGNTGGSNILKNSKLSLKMQMLIKDPFPKVKHQQKWIGSPSSNRGLTYSSSSNHFIQNIQEIPRKVPPVPESSIILEMREIQREKKNNRRRRRPKSSHPHLEPIKQFNHRRPKTAPTTDGKSWALTKEIDSMMCLGGEEEDGDDNGYYNDDFEAVPSTSSSPTRPRTAPGNGAAQRRHQQKGDFKSKFRTRSSKGSRGSSKGRKNAFGRLKHAKAWIGSPSTNRELTYSSTSNRIINNIQSIPKIPPRIPGEREFDNIFPESSSILSQPSNVTSIPSQIEDIYISQRSRRTGGGYIVNSNNLKESIEKDIIVSSSSSTSLHKKNKKWIGSPSSKLPFTFSRTANKHFTQLQMWPQYDATKDVGCSYTHSKSFQKFQKSQVRAEYIEKTKNVIKRQNEMRRKQKGAFSAAVTMTESSLPTDVDDTITALFNSISSKLYIGWKDRRGQMMNYPNICRGLSKNKRRGGSTDGYINDMDMYSSLLAIGVDLNDDEYTMLKRVLLPTNKHGHYSSSKVVELIMSGKTLIAEYTNDDEEDASRPAHHGMVIHV